MFFEQKIQKKINNLSKRIDPDYIRKISAALQQQQHFFVQIRHGMKQLVYKDARNGW